jgi:hypothetical protein
LVEAGAEEALLDFVDSVDFVSAGLGVDDPDPDDPDDSDGADAAPDPDDSEVLVSEDLVSEDLVSEDLDPPVDVRLSFL